MSQIPDIPRPIPSPELPPETAEEEEGQYAQEEKISWCSFVALLAGLILAYWPGFRIATEAWSMEMYSHGWIIPLLAGMLLWLRREPYRPFPAYQTWIGVGLLALSLLARLFTSYYSYEIPNLWTFVPAVAACFLIVGGWPMFRWAAPVCFILFFMFPLPWTFEHNLLEPMQKWATLSSTYLLQLIGLETYNTGNIITVCGIPMNVVGACSGLRMTTIFLALSIALVLIAQRVWWENLIIILCAIPIALAVNITRITVTGIGYSIFGVGGTAEKLIHDWSGLAMVPMALILLWGILRLLSLLSYEDNSEDIVSLYQQNLGGADRGVHKDSSSKVDPVNRDDKIEPNQ